MKSMVVLFIDWERDQLEFVGCFSTEADAVKCAWNRECNNEFSAWPVHGSKEDATDVVFRENEAVMHLRTVDRLPQFQGVGPAAAFRIWILQRGLVGSTGYVVARFKAATDNEKDAHIGRHQNLRFKYNKSGNIFADVSSPLGQEIEELLQTWRARYVQDTMLQTRDERKEESFASNILPSSEVEETIRDFNLKPFNWESYVEIKQELCTNCGESPYPGALFPVAKNGDTSRAYIEMCDECDLLTDDAIAAILVGHFFRRPIKTTADNGLYMVGVTFDEAAKLDEGARRNYKENKQR